MSKQLQAGSGWKKILFGFLGVLLSLVVAFFASNLGDFYDHLDQFNSRVKDYDKEAAQGELEILRNYYSSFSGWGLRYLADKYLLSDMFLYEAEVAYLAEDYGAAIDGLKDHQDNPLALHIIGSSKFMVLRAAYQEDKARGGKNGKAIIKKILDEVNPDFKKAVELGPGPAKAFEYSWNYDCTSNDDCLKRALESPKPKPKFVLGTSGKPTPGKPIPGGGAGKKPNSSETLDGRKNSDLGPTKKGG